MLEYTLLGRVRNILFILCCFHSGSVAYVWTVRDVAANLCFAPSIADFRHPFLSNCFAVSCCI